MSEPIEPTGDPAQDTPNPGTDQPAGTDWKAEARKWEGRAKENTGAADALAKAKAELEKLKAQGMSAAEKAIADARSEGMTEAARTYGTKLAQAELKAAAASAGVDLTEVSEYIDLGKFLDENGDVDAKAIKAAVTKFAKTAPKAASRSGGDFPGGPTGGAITEDQFSAMTAEEKVAALQAGKLKHLL